jgi:hypothetical protein
MDNFDLRKFLAENKLTENRGTMRVFRVYEEIAYEGPYLDTMKLFFNEEDAREYAAELEAKNEGDEVVIDETTVE